MVGWSGQNRVTVSILPSTTYFASNNTNNAAPLDLRDLNPANPAILDSRGVNLNDITQGALGDCFLLSAIGSMAQRTPQAVLDLFVYPPVANGYVSVRIYREIGADPVMVRVRRTLDFGISQARLSNDYFDAGNVRYYEIWTQLLEKAYAQYFGWERVINGGSAFRVWQHFTGQATQVVVASNQTIPQITTALRNAVSAGQKVILSTHNNLESEWRVTIPGDPNPYTIISGHAYVVQSIDANDIVTLYNPHGPEAFPPRFRLADFKEYFWRIQKQ